MTPSRACFSGARAEEWMEGEMDALSASDVDLTSSNPDQEVKYGHGLPSPERLCFVILNEVLII